MLIVYASMYGNTEAAAQALATRLCEKGVTSLALYDVSNTHVSYLIAETFKYSHVVLASVTYNLSIYPVMKNYLEDEMKNMIVLNERLSLASFMLPDKAAELEHLADALVEFLQETSG